MRFERDYRILNSPRSLYDSFKLILESESLNFIRLHVKVDMEIEARSVSNKRAFYRI